MKVSGVYRRTALIEFNNTDFVAGTFVPALILPNNARIVGGNLVVDTASNAGTTDTLAFGIVGTPARNLAATTLKATGMTALTATTVVTGETLGITRATVGTADTALRGYLAIDYVYPGGCDYIVGDLPGTRDLNNGVPIAQ